MGLIAEKRYYIKPFQGSADYLSVCGGTPVKDKHNTCLATKNNSDSQQWIARLEKNYAKIYTALAGGTTYALNIHSITVPNCTLYTATGNDKDSLVDFLTVDAEKNLYHIKLKNYSLYLTAKDSTNAYWGSPFVWQLEEVPNAPISKGNYLTYPCKVMNISQRHDGKYSHFPNSSGTPADYPIDEACENSARSYFHCPCDEMEITRIVGVKNAYTNTIWLSSTSQVTTPIGVYNVVIMVTHPEDDDLSVLSVGQRFKRGQPMFREGKDGNATGNHFHMSIGKGAIVGSGWTQNNKGGWVLTTTQGALYVNQGFYINKSFTTVHNSALYTFTPLP